MISWKKVVECFQNSEYKVIKQQNYNQEYWNQETLYKGMTADDETILYIVKASALPDVTLENNVAVIILNDEEANVQLIQQHMGNMIVVKEASDVPKGVIALDLQFRIQFKIGYVMQKLLDCVSKDEGIQEVIEIISNFFKEPVAVLDTTFRFIARSQTYKPLEGKTIFSDAAHYGDGYNKRMLEYFRKKGLLEKLIHSNDPFSFNLADEENAYYMPVIVNRIKVAYLIVYSNKKGNFLEEYYFEYLPLFAQMVSIELAKNNFYLFNKGSYFNYIFSLILSNEKVDVEDIRMRLQVYDYYLRENMYLIEIKSEVQDANPSHKDKIASSIRNLFKNSFYVFKEDKIYFLISRFKEELISKEEMDLWEMSLESQNLIGAITGPFTDFKNIQQHMKEVRMVLDAAIRGKEKKHMYSFEEYQTKAMLTYIQKEDLNMFLYKPVLKLIDYDERHNTELVNTLKEYLKHPREIGAICDRLCIHKNTLYKRLDKIDSVMECDYRNGHEIMKIELTLEMLQR